MLCEKCHQKQATMHMQQYVNGEKTEMHLCQDCAAALEIPFSFDNLFQGFLGSFLTKPQVDIGGNGKEAHTVVKCGTCGLSYDGFKKTGRLGCADCYSAFRQELDAIFKSVQSSNQHQGKFPRKYGGELFVKRELDQLKLSLAKAVENEEYEEAVLLRDKIREYENR